ncbi:MAG: ATP-binding protein [Candidatus Cloacimonadaceae bacterium]
MRIAIASGKGGTGKTTLAVNLALRSAETHNVVLADLDVEEPNSAIFVKGKLVSEQQMFRAVPHWDKQKCTLCGKCTEVCHYHAVLKLGNEILVLPELCHSCYACSELCPVNALPMQDVPLGFLRHFESDRLHFIESKLDIGVEMASPLIHQTLDYLDKKHPEADYQFLDCPPGTSCSVITATKDADFVMLVTEPTPFGLYDLSLAVETMQHLGKPMAVVVNRYGIGNEDVFQYCESQNIPVWAKLPNQRAIAELYSSGEVIYNKIPEFKKGMDAILSELDKLAESR